MSIRIDIHTMAGVTNIAASYSKRYTEFCTYCNVWCPGRESLIFTCCFKCDQDNKQKGMCFFCCKELEVCSCRKCIDCNMLISYKKDGDEYCEECEEEYGIFSR